MKEQNFQIGRLVRSRAGRDAGRYFVITGFPEENYAYISDGAVRKLNAPKKKKLKHLELCPQDVQAIRAKLPPSASVVALCVEGKERSSEDFARLLSTWEHSSAKHLVFVIGGSYGLDPALKAEAWARLSMSPMTFPHHLARVMLLEQLYRAFKIQEGSSYHK